MYEWRQLSSEERLDVLEMRKLKKLPWHSPPHFGKEDGLYHITAACYEHASILSQKQRLSDFESRLIDGILGDGVGEIKAWVVLPNHYHFLLKTDLPEFGKWIGKLHNKTSTQWNGEDGLRGRKVWHRYSDRKIRGEIHYYRTINYIHFNPVKHRYAENAREWPWSSFIGYEEKYGREELVRWWLDYPITGYGIGWDE